MAPQMASAATASGRVERWLRLATALLRLAQYGAPLPTVISTSVSDIAGRSGLILATYLVGATWSVVMFASAWRNRSPIRPAAAVVDVLLLCALQTLMVSVFGPEPQMWGNWTYGPAIGASLVVLVFGPPKLRWWLTLAPSVAWAAAMSGAYLATDQRPNVDVLIWGMGEMLFVLLGAYVSKVLRTLARDVDQARHAESLAIQREAELRASLQERRRQWRMLHDTALNTLESIAGGDLDSKDEWVRQLCGRDANYLRGLMMGAEQDTADGVVARLTDVLRDRSHLGLTVHPQFDRLPPELPASVVDAVILAVREALNNVVKHATASEAWLTAVGTPEKGLQVTIVDRGTGFDVGRGSARGLTRSIRHPIEEVGGSAVIDSAPGEGTTVELTWNPK